jgi:hypothetical protein
MKSEFNEERPLDLDEQSLALVDWDRRVRRMAHSLCSPKGHFEPGDRTGTGDLVEYCSECYRCVRMVTDLWAEVFAFEDGKADRRAKANNHVQFIPVAAMYSVAAGLLDPNKRKALEGYGVL